MIYNTLLLVLALYKAAVMWKENSGFGGMVLVKVLIRDQAIYFLACTSISCASMLPVLMLNLQHNFCQRDPRHRNFYRRQYAAG